jgi:hypothetical protein
MRPLLKSDQSKSLAPAMHLEFIQNHAGFNEADGLAEVEAYHRSVFLHHHARDMERFQQEARIHEDRLSHLESQLKETQTRLGTIEKLVPVSVNGEPDTKPTAPWNFWDRAMFFGAGLGVLCLLVFGILNISFNLLESGLVTFRENPLRAYLWAALLPVGALAVKIGWDFLQRSRARDIYLWTCLSLGIGGVVVWVAAYATVYPTLSKSTTEQINSLSVFDQKNDSASLAGMNGAGVKRVDAVIVAAQAAAEILLSAVLGIYMTVIYSRHRPVRLSLNPLFGQLDDERKSLQTLASTERLALAEARGRLSQLENQMTAFVSCAKSMFHKEVALRRDETHQKQALLDRISEQIRTQLETPPPASNGAVRGKLALGQENGR